MPQSTKFTRTTIPAQRRIILMRVGLGYTDLAMKSDRQVFSAHKTPHFERFCTMPNSRDCMEDNEHILVQGVHSYQAESSVHDYLSLTLAR